MIVLKTDFDIRTIWVRIEPRHFGPQLCPRCGEFGETTRWFDIGDASGYLNLVHKCRRCHWTFVIEIHDHDILT